MRSAVIRCVPFLALVLAACSASGDDGGSDEAELQSLKVYFADAKRLDLSDLTRAAVGFGTEALNNQLSVSTGPVQFGVRFEPPGVFAPQAEPNSLLPDNVEV